MVGIGHGAVDIVEIGEYDIAPEDEAVELAGAFGAAACAQSGAVGVVEYEQKLALSGLGVARVHAYEGTHGHEPRHDGNVVET